MEDREVCIVPATSAARRIIRRHFREWKANSASFPHHPSSSSPQCPEGDLLCARHRYIFLVTVLLKAGGDIFHALIMGAYLYIPVYVPYLAMASGLILGTRDKD